MHRLLPGKKLMLGGMHIPCEVGSDAHSDGDVVLHSLVDALLGACALGDIGDHFPPSDDRYKNMASIEFLRHVLPMLKHAGAGTDTYTIQNVDITIFLEKPKLGPYKEAMRQLIAQELKLPVHCIAVKAKTAEKFPPIGTQDAIAASTTVLLALEA